MLMAMPRSRRARRWYAAALTQRASGGIGRRAGFRFLCPQGRGGSSPPSRTLPRRRVARIVVVNAVVVAVASTATAAAHSRIERVRGTDEREVRERLREVPDELPEIGVVLLGEQADVVGATEHALEASPRFVRAAGERERFDQPERAGQERALGLADAVGRGIARLIPMHEAVDRQVLVDGLDGRDDARVVAGKEPDQRN